MKIIFFLLIVVIFCGCKKNIVGFYYYPMPKTAALLSNCTLNLYPDSTYFFRESDDLIESIDSGKWSLNCNILSLSSSISDDVVLTSPGESNNADIIVFEILQLDSLPLYGAIIVINDTIEYLSDENGIVRVSKVDIKTIQIRWSKYTKSIVLYNTNLCNKFTLYINLDLLVANYPLDGKYRVSKNKIVFRQRNGNKIFKKDLRQH